MPNPREEAPRRDELVELFRKQAGGSARREYPEGRIGADDEGALAVAIVKDVRHGAVIIRFPKPIEWFALSPQGTVELAQMMIRNARELSKEPLRVVIE